MAKPKAKTDRLQDREVSTSELAVIVGKSPQWIRKLTRDNFLIYVGRGKYMLGECVQVFGSLYYSKRPAVESHYQGRDVLCACP